MKVRNISTGPRGVWRKGVLTTVDPGKAVDADDWNEEWFARASETSDDVDIASLDLLALVDVAVVEGVIESVDVLSSGLRRSILSKREVDAAHDPLDHDNDGLAGGMTNLDLASPDDILAAIDLLDGTNDDHWTSAGLPAVKAVEELAGKTVTRAAIEAAAPDAKRVELESDA